jgi:ATP/maltotriose-dependent transcriptional regulator MalT/DNA-binding SARP family transcriptional activator
LLALLDESREQPIAWVSGPAGSGKTTLVGNYLDERKLPCLWYQVDAGDADPASFFYHMGLAAQKAAPRYRKSLPLLTPEYLAGIPVFTRRFFENIYARLKPPFAIVFDNYQEASEQSHLHELINIGLSLIPKGIQIFVLSRNEPPPSFMRLRANSAMQVVGWDELRFTLEESKQLVRLKTKQKPTEDAIEELYRKTEGWAAGLVLLTESAGTKKPGPQSVGEPDQREVFNYFAGEVFNKLDSDTRDFLLMTSFLPTMTARMAEKMTDQDNAGRILTALNRNHFFTEKHQTGEPSYQYHALFREFLLTRMKESRNPEGIHRIQNRAAVILEEAGRVEDAARLSWGAEDWNNLTRLVVTHAGVLAMQGRARTIEEWLENIPGEIIIQNPWLLYWLGVSRMSHDLHEGRQRFEQAYSLFKVRGDSSGLYLSWSGIVETFVYEWSDFQPLDRWIAEAEVLLRNHPEFPSAEIEARFASSFFCSLMYRQPYHRDLPKWEEHARKMIDSIEDLRLKIMVSSHLVFYYTWWNGDQSKAAMLVNTLRSAVHSAEISPLVKVVWQAIEAAFSWMTGDNEACLAAVKGGLRIAEETGVRLWDFMLLAQASFGTLTAGDFDAAKTYHDRMVFISGTGRKLDIAHYHYHLGWAAMCRRNFPLAREHMEMGLKTAEETGEPFIAAFIRMGVAEVMIELGDCRKAKKYLDEARKTGLLIRSNTVEYQYLWLEAVRCLREGDREKALVSLRRHLALSREYGILNHAAWRSSVMVPLYAMALGEGIEVEHVRALIKKRNLNPTDAIAESNSQSAIRDLQLDNWPWPLKIYTLGRFELVKDGELVKFSGKVQQKPLALLKALIAFGGKDVAEEQFTDALWPEADGDLAHRSFEMAVHRLRKLIGKDKVVQLQERRLSLDAGLCWVDVWAFEKAVENAEFGIRSEDGGEKGKSAIPLFEKAISLYKGHFFPSDSAQPWVLSYRERLRSKFHRAIIKLGTHREQAMQWEGAVEVFRRGLEVDGLAEDLCRHLMVCHQKLGQRAEAIAAYNRCSALLSSTLGIAPSSRTEDLYQSIRKG